MKKINWNKIWQLAKPVIITVLSLTGLLTTKFFSVPWILFLFVLALSFIFRGKDIKEGFKEIRKSIGGGGIKPPKGD